jgi:hypothetical protein
LEGGLKLFCGNWTPLLKILYKFMYLTSSS